MIKVRLSSILFFGFSVYAMEFPYEYKSIHRYSEYQKSAVIFYRAGIDSTIQPHCPEGEVMFHREMAWAPEPGTYGNRVRISNQINLTDTWICFKLANQADTEFVLKTNPIGLKADSILSSPTNRGDKNIKTAPFPFIKWVSNLEASYGYRRNYKPNSQQPNSWVMNSMSDTMWMQVMLVEGFSQKCDTSWTGNKHGYTWRNSIIPACKAMPDSVMHPGETHSYQVYFNNPPLVASIWPTNVHKWDSIDYPKREWAIFFERPKLWMYRLDSEVMLAHVQAKKHGNTYDKLYAISKAGTAVWNVQYASYYESEKENQQVEIGIKDGAFRVKLTTTKNGVTQIKSLKWDKGPVWDKD